MIGIFGGTFDPIHFGHLRAALEIREALGLRELRLLPLNQAVHRAQPLADGALRLAMVRAAVDGEPGMVADDRELRRPGGSYSVDTLTEVRAEVGPDEPLCLLVGGDAFNTFFEWHRPRDILELAHLAVMQRPGSVLPRDPELREELERRRAQARGDLHAGAGRAHLAPPSEPVGYRIQPDSAHHRRRKSGALPTPGRRASPRDGCGLLQRSRRDPDAVRSRIDGQPRKPTLIFL
jgi:nicotinate-nucleotide adenylyltransferase